jgi:hypothetical protein
MLYKSTPDASPTGVRKGMAVTVGPGRCVGVGHGVRVGKGVHVGIWNLCPGCNWIGVGAVQLVAVAGGGVWIGDHDCPVCGSIISQAVKPMSKAIAANANTLLRTLCFFTVTSRC